MDDMIGQSVSWSGDLGHLNDPVVLTVQKPDHHALSASPIDISLIHILPLGLLPCYLYFVKVSEI